MAVNTSQWQLRRREAGWEGSRRRNRDLRNTNRIEGGTVWASRLRATKPVVIKRSFRKCGGCAMKVAGLIRGDLYRCSRCLVLMVRGVVRDGWGQKVLARCGEVSRRHSTGGIVVRREGLNAKSRRRTFVLAGCALKAANPVRGLDEEFCG